MATLQKALLGEAEPGFEDISQLSTLALEIDETIRDEPQSSNSPDSPPCPLWHPNHSTAFFRMLDAILPDWRERKQRLEQTEI